MANTRTRKPRAKAPAETTQEEFDPSAVQAGNPADPEFYDSQNQPAEGDAPEDPATYPEDTDGDIADSEQVFSPESETEQEDDDPSAGNQLGKTVAGMSEGTQAAAAELRDYMRRLQNLAAERDEIAGDIKDLKKEIKSKGYDMKAFDLILKIDSLDEAKKKARRDQNSINTTYAHAVGIDEDLL